jgi:HEAT repeat protein
MTASAILTGTPAARAAAIAGLAVRDPPPNDAEIAAVLESLGDPSKLVQRRTAETLAALRHRGVAVEAAVLSKLAGPELRARWGAAYTLSLFGPLPASVVPVLLEVMGVEDGDLRWAASDLLKQVAATHRSHVIGALTAAAAVAGPGRKMALYCLRDLDVADALPIAEAALDDGAIDVRLAALAAVAALDTDPMRSAERIARFVDDADPRMQRAAAGTLGSLGVSPPMVMEALTKAEQSNDASLRRAAAQAKRRLGGSGER